MVEAVDGVLKALSGFIERCSASIGPTWTFITLACVVLLGAVWRVYQDRRKDREVDAVVAEKEKTIQRLAGQERGWRAYFMSQSGLTDQQIELFLMKNEFPDGPTARKALEGDKTKSAGKTKQKPGEQKGGAK